MAETKANPVMAFDLQQYASPRRALIEQRLDEYLKLQDPSTLWEAMRYSVLSGGKRLRALLCLAAAEALTVPTDDNKAQDLAVPCACAIEMIHAMSLIHDDLPCMDNDDFRRGKPTNHKVFGEALALLAGDALLVLANETLIKHSPHHIDRNTLLEVSMEMSRATGPDGMVGGQVSDCIATGLLPECNTKSSSPDKDTVELLESIHKRKTGALLRFSAWSGAKLAGASKEVAAKIAEFGDVLGLSFQITDDLLDLSGDFETLGKTPGKDIATGKVTWVSVYGIEGSKNALIKLEARGKSLLKDTGLPEKSTAALSSLLEYAIQRKS